MGDIENAPKRHFAEHDRSIEAAVRFALAGKPVAVSDLRNRPPALAERPTSSRQRRYVADIQVPGS